MAQIMQKLSVEQLWENFKESLNKDHNKDSGLPAPHTRYKDARWFYTRVTELVYRQLYGTKYTNLTVQEAEARKALKEHLVSKKDVKDYIPEDDAVFWQLNDRLERVELWKEHVGALFQVFEPIYMDITGAESYDPETVDKYKNTNASGTAKRELSADRVAMIKEVTGKSPGTYPSVTTPASTEDKKAKETETVEQKKAKATLKKAEANKKDKANGGTISKEALAEAQKAVEELEKDKKSEDKKDDDLAIPAVLKRNKDNSLPTKEQLAVADDGIEDDTETVTDTEETTEDTNDDPPFTPDKPQRGVIKEENGFATIETGVR